jgi:hypothetical protein
MPGSAHARSQPLRTTACLWSNLLLQASLLSQGLLLSGVILVAGVCCCLTWQGCGAEPGEQPLHLCR